MNFLRKIILVSHNDLDGIGAVVLAKATLDNLETHMISGSDEANSFIHEIIKNDADSIIYITDLSVNEEIAKLLDERTNVYLFDHHPTAEHLKKFGWCTIHLDTNNKKCATKLFYEYLLDHVPYESIETLKLYQNFVDNVNDWDTWLWEEKENITAKELNDLYFMTDADYFINRFLDNYSVVFTEKERFALDLRTKEISKYIEEKNSLLRKYTRKFVIDGVEQTYSYGVVTSESHNSECGNELGILNPDLDFILLFNASTGKVSLRSRKDDVDLSKIAKMNNGGGHQKAAGYTIKSDLINILSDHICKTGYDKNRDIDELLDFISTVNGIDLNKSKNIFTSIDDFYKIKKGIYKCEKVQCEKCNGKGIIVSQKSKQMCTDCNNKGYIYKYNKK